MSLATGWTNSSQVEIQWETDHSQNNKRRFTEKLWLTESSQRVLLKEWSQTAVTSSGILLEIQIIRFPFRSTGPGIGDFKKPCMEFGCMLVFEHHCSRVICLLGCREAQLWAPSLLSCCSYNKMSNLSSTVCGGIILNIWYKIILNLIAIICKGILVLSFWNSQGNIFL